MTENRQPSEESQADSELRVEDLAPTDIDPSAAEQVRGGLGQLRSMAPPSTSISSTSSSTDTSGSAT